MTARPLHTAGSMTARRTAAAPIVVVGDVMLDVDLVGNSVRQSPEAPVPVLHDLSERRRPGGAALAALLAARGSHRVVLIAPIADDEAAQDIRDVLGDQVELIELPWDGTTPVKTRVRAGNHPIARLDRGGATGPIGEIPDRVADALGSAAAILVSDYGLGITADPRVRAHIASAAETVPVVWDPHPRGASSVAGTTLVTPNERELFAVLEREPAGSLAGVGRAAATLHSKWGVQAVCVTLGDHGALLCLHGDPAAGDETLIHATTPVVGSDTCGAGDSFAAASAIALADGASAHDAVTQAVATASRFVAAGGAAAFDPRRPAPAIATDDLDTRLAEVRRAGGVVVATGGCFDLLHAGHVATLDAARALGDFLVVCLNSDDSVRRLKGPQRPLQTAAERALVLSAMQSVDAVTVFTEDTPVEALRRVRPDIWAKGGDYSGKTLPEAAVLSEWGGRVVTLAYVAGISTTDIVARAIRSAAG